MRSDRVFAWVVIALVVGIITYAVFDSSHDVKPDAHSSATPQGATPSSATRQPTAAEYQQQLDVQVACEQAIKRQLVSPGSMKRVVDSVPALKGGTWTYVTVVDSQNGFGALVRSKWGCQVTGGEVTNLSQLPLD